MKELFNTKATAKDEKRKVKSENTIAIKG